MQRVRHYVDLSDGRKLAYAMFGATLQQQPQQYASAPAAGSHPIMYHHGWPSSWYVDVISSVCDTNCGMFECTRQHSFRRLSY